MELKGKNLDSGIKREIHRRIEGIAWGLFFVWVGIAYFADLGNGIGLLGIGIITLGAQLARYLNGLKLEGFWVLVGVFFTLGGLWDFMDPGIALVPILLIIAGTAMIYAVMRKGRTSRPEDRKG